MWKVTAEHLEDLAIGAGILGTGGGGNPFLGKLEALEHLKRGAEMRVVGLEEVADDAFATTVGGMGSPTVGIERIRRGDEAQQAHLLGVPIGRRQERRADSVFPLLDKT